MAALKCPRCEAAETVKEAESPVKGKFEVYRCEACNYVWRSTEDLSEIDQWIEQWREGVNTTMLEH